MFILFQYLFRLLGTRCCFSNISIAPRFQCTKCQSVFYVLQFTKTTIRLRTKWFDPDQIVLLRLVFVQHANTSIAPTLSSIIQQHKKAMTCVDKSGGGVHPATEAHRCSVILSFAYIWRTTLERAWRAKCGRPRDVSWLMVIAACAMDITPKCMLTPSPRHMCCAMSRRSHGDLHLCGSKRFLLSYQLSAKAVHTQIECVYRVAISRFGHQSQRVIS